MGQKRAPFAPEFKMIPKFVNKTEARLNSSSTITCCCWWEESGGGKGAENKNIKIRINQRSNHINLWNQRLAFGPSRGCNKLRPRTGSVYATQQRVFSLFDLSVVVMPPLLCYCLVLHVTMSHSIWFWLSIHLSFRGAFHSLKRHPHNDHNFYAIVSMAKLNRDTFPETWSSDEDVRFERGRVIDPLSQCYGNIILRPFVIEVSFFMANSVVNRWSSI